MRFSTKVLVLSLVSLVFANAWLRQSPTDAQTEPESPADGVRFRSDPPAPAPPLRDPAQLTRLRDEVRRHILVADNAPGFNADYLITDADFVEPILDRVFTEVEPQDAHIDELYSIAGLRYQEALAGKDGIARLKRRMIERFTHPLVAVKSTSVPGDSDEVAELRRAAETVIAVTHGEVPNTVQRPARTSAHAWVEVTADFGLLPGQLLQPNQLSYRDSLLIYDRYGEAKSFFEDGNPATAVVAAQLSALRSAHPDADLITMKIEIAGDHGPYDYVYRVHAAPGSGDASLQIAYPHVAYATKSARTADIRIVDGDLAPYASGTRSFYRSETRNPWEIAH